MKLELLGWWVRGWEEGGAVRLLAGILEVEPLKCKWKYTYTEVLMLRVKQVTCETKI